MKKLTFTITTVMLLLIAGCARNGDNEIKFVNCIVDGVQWNSDGTSYINKNLNALNISGSNNDAVLIVYVKNVPGLGTYSLTTNDGQTELSFQRKLNIPITYSIKSSRPESHGTITITKVNPGTSLLDYVEGTFTGVAYSSSSDSVVITNGQFAYSK